MILSKEKILSFYKDNTVDVVIEELILTQKELSAIGVNINEITHYFHTADTACHKIFQALKVAEQYKKIGDKVDRLFEVVSQVNKKRLQK